MYTVAGVLAKAHEQAKQFFEYFQEVFDAAIKETGLPQDIIRLQDPTRLRAIYGGSSFPGLSIAARSLPTDVSDYIWSQVKRGVAHIEGNLYKGPELALINRAYAGQLMG